MRNTACPDNITRLVALGKCSLGKYNNKRIDYISLGITREDIAELFQIAMDKNLPNLEIGDPGIWPAIHAWRALSQLKVVRSIEPLIEMFDEYEDDSYAINELPIVLGMVSDKAVGLLGEDVADSNQDELSRIAAVECIMSIAIKLPERRSESEGVFKEFLDTAGADTSRLNSIVVSALVDLKTKEAIGIIRSGSKKKSPDMPKQKIRKKLNA